MTLCCHRANGLLCTASVCKEIFVGFGMHNRDTDEVLPVSVPYCHNVLVVEWSTGVARSACMHSATRCGFIWTYWYAGRLLLM